MTITLQAVNELIASLESAGELSIKETKVMALAKAYQQLAAENVGIDGFVEDMLAIAWQGGSADGSDIQEIALRYGLIQLEVYCADKHENCVYDPGNFDDGDAVYFRTETPATDRIVAGIKADGVEEWVSSRGGRWNGTTEEALKFAKQLREGDK
ncbi:hypothetical protein [Klebsiella pneumoniae]|uniref:hypothetical protein n=1 Tax=Klebsiella pneumoniae TaxID=573 RepID=UPI001E41E029|nr:hypothetical protein [Klebsiella pneumoniae]MCE3583296.1 hypothetical protein [Klebsiella pneumoniae]HBY8809049.1 hypothetical protein [Klebsiella pneumoniae]HBY9897235.1 hypothetical protein [Klebsiella pneumoniae]HBY9946466.1 hypothetical protein [Klebsiella pneumoniae]